MTGYQFIHIEAYGRTKPKKAASKLTMLEVAEENERAVGSVPHVDEPAHPMTLYGSTPSTVVEAALEQMKVAKTRCGDKYRKLRSDANIVIAGVASHPFESADIAQSLEKKAQYLCWEKDTISWLQDRYGSKLKSVVRHEDEKFGHIHFWVLDDLDHSGDEAISHGVSRIHPGMAAKRKAKEVGATAKSQNLAYKAAMREFLDYYYESVGMRNGLLRSGPKRRRLKRKEWQQEKADAQAAVKLRQESEKLSSQVEADKAQIEQLREGQAQNRRKYLELRGREMEVEYNTRKMEEKKLELGRAEQEITMHERTVEEKAKDLEQMYTVMNDPSSHFSLDRPEKQNEGLRPRVKKWIEQLQQRFKAHVHTSLETLRLKQKEAELAQKQAEHLSKESKEMIEKTKSFMVAVIGLVKGTLLRDGGKQEWRLGGQVSDSELDHYRTTISNLDSTLLELNDNLEREKEVALQKELKRLQYIENEKQAELVQLREMNELLNRKNKIIDKYVKVLSEEELKEVGDAMEVQMLVQQYTDGQSR